MATLHRSEDISTHPKFDNRLFYFQVLGHQNPWVCFKLHIAGYSADFVLQMLNFEYSAGLSYNELNEDTVCSENHIAGASPSILLPSFSHTSSPTPYG